MDILLYTLLLKKIKQYLGSNYKNSTTRSDSKNVYLDVVFFKADKTEDVVTLTIPKPKDGVSMISADFNGNDIEIKMSDNTTIIMNDAKLLLKGEKGDKGDKGETGAKGDKGDNGLTNYQIAVNNGYTGTVVEWLKELEGDNSYEIWKKYNPTSKLTEQQWSESLKGDSAYQIYIKNNPTSTLTEKQWTDSLKAKGFTDRGKYNPNAIYNSNDYVTYGNKMWSYQDHTTDLQTSTIMGITPDKADGNPWSLMLEVVVDNSNIINDGVEKTDPNSNNMTWSVSRLGEELLKLAKNNNVITKDNTTPFNANFDTEPMTKGYTKQLMSETSIDTFKDGKYKKSEENFTTALKNKLENANASDRGAYPNEVEINRISNPIEGNTAWNMKTNTMWAYNGGVWKDTFAKSLGDMQRTTYDPQNIGKDVFVMGNHQETDQYKHYTRDEQLKLKELDKNKIDGVPVDSATRGNRMALVYNANTGKYEHDTLFESTSLIGFRGNPRERGMMKNDSRFNGADFIFLDTSLRVLMYYIAPWGMEQTKGHFVQYEGQQLANPLPANPLDGEQFMGKAVIYEYNKAFDFWQITGAITPNNTFNNGVKTTEVQFITDANVVIKDKVGNKIVTSDSNSNIQIEKDLIVKGNIINDGLKTLLSSSNGYKIMTQDLFNSYMKNNPLNCTVWNTSCDCIINVYNGVAYEVNQTSNGIPMLPLKAIDKQTYIDIDNTQVFQYDSTLGFWRLVVEKFIQAKQMRNSEVFNFAFNYVQGTGTEQLEIQYLSFDATQYKVSVSTSKPTQYLRILLREFSEPSKQDKFVKFLSPIDNSIHLRDFWRDNFVLELSVSCEKGAMVQNFRIKCVGGVIAILDVWQTEFTRPSDYDFNYSTTSERMGNKISPPLFPKAYFDVDLKEMLMIRRQFPDINMPPSIGTGAYCNWASFDPTYEVFNFPLPAKDGEVFVSPKGVRYVFNLAGYYWKQKDDFSLKEDGIPIGTIQHIDTTYVTPNIKWVECSGQTLTQDIYATSPYYNKKIPNINGEMATIIGGNVPADIGKFVGSNLSYLSWDKLPPHNHYITRYTRTTGWSGTSTYKYVLEDSTGYQNSQTINTNSVGGNGTGNANPIDMKQRSLICKAFIKVLP